MESYFKCFSVIAGSLPQFGPSGFGKPNRWTVAVLAQTQIHTHTHTELIWGIKIIMYSPNKSL